MRTSPKSLFLKNLGTPKSPKNPKKILKNSGLRTTFRRPTFSYFTHTKVLKNLTLRIARDKMKTDTKRDLKLLTPITYSQFMTPLSEIFQPPVTTTENLATTLPETFDNSVLQEEIGGLEDELGQIATAPPMEAVSANELLVPQASPCTELVCLNGHTWPTQLKLGKCPGCDFSVVVIELQNCPQCNEPYDKMSFRVDISSPAIGLGATCKGEFGRGISNIVTLERVVDEVAVQPRPQYPGAPASQLEDAAIQMAEATQYAS